MNELPDKRVFVFAGSRLDYGVFIVNDMPTLASATAEEAAMSVYTQHSGCTVCDQLKLHAAPDHLNGRVLHEACADA